MYAEPISVDDPSTCSFYHRIEIPGHGLVGNQWDLRSVVDNYLGNVDFRGKRVLDVGTAGGFLTFEMERRGADVVSFDMTSGASWNVVPQAAAQQGRDQHAEHNLRAFQALKNAYWFTHERLKSKAKVFYGDIYNLPVELGNFDIVVFGMILGHLRDPFEALHSGSKLCTDKVIVTNQSESRKRKWFRGKRNAASARFIPSRQNGIKQAWWALSDQCVAQMLEVLGFDCVARYTSYPECLVPSRRQKEKCRTTVTTRVAGQACGIDLAVRKAA